jgi:pantoate--beta-alanine ligase
MHVVDNIDELRQLIGRWRSQGQRIAFVPTMGNLHEGHLSLVEIADRNADRTVVSIFVNPMQFGPDEDFERYPRTLEDDLAQLKAKQTDLVFIPSRASIYPQGETATTYVEVPELSNILEGEFRPGFFRGVATIVLKLLNLVQPHVAVFGEKDFQQYLVIKRMVAELDLPVEIIPAEIRREPGGLAMSSRNRYLSQSERERAEWLYLTLQQYRRCLVDGLAGCQDEHSFRQLMRSCEQQAQHALAEQGFDVDYVSLRETAALMPPRFAELNSERPLIILLAARIGTTRLIDNLKFTLNYQ